MLREIESTGEIEATTSLEEYERLFTHHSPAHPPIDGNMLHARLNSVGKHVVCGLRACGARLAYVGHPTAEDIANAEENGASVLACIQFLPGWAQRQDGVWAFSRHAKLLRRWGRRVKTRRYPGHDGAILNDVMDSYYDTLPVTAKCSECGFLNLLTEGELGVSLLLRVPAKPA